MELLLVRHALPIRRELVEGVADPELSESGLRQAEHLAQYLSSERDRCRVLEPDAARPADRRPGRRCVRASTCRSKPGLAEFDQNSPEYIPVEELKAANDPRWHRDGRRTHGTRDENEAEFRARTIGSIESIIERHPGQRVVAACHGGVINLYLAHVLGLTESAPAGSSIRTTRRSTGSPPHRAANDRSSPINETSHLRGTGLPMGLFQKG